MEIDWLKKASRTRGLQEVFGDSPLSLQNVALHRIELRRDGPTLVLIFDLADYPADPPKKWVVQKFNTVQVELYGIGMSEVSISGYTRDLTADIDITTAPGGGIRIKASSPDEQIDAIVEFLSVARFTAYQNG